MKQNRLLLIVLVILAAGISWFIFSRSSSTLGRELQNFSIEDTASIDKIFIADKNGNSSTLDRVNYGSWKVNNKYPVRVDAMKTLLETFHKMKVRNPVAKSLKTTFLDLICAASDVASNAVCGGALSNSLAIKLA